MLAWLNDQLIEDRDLHISPDDRGFTLADGVFDTLLVQDGRIKLGVSHFSRLLRHATHIGITLPYDVSALLQSARALIAKNKLSSGRYSLRTQITRGTGPRGLMPPPSTQQTILMRLSPAPPILAQPIKAICVTGYKNEHSPLASIKSLNYLDHQLALMRAKADGFDDAILLNTTNHLACATTANVFIKVNGTWLTPPLGDGALDGVVRKLYVRARQVVEKSLSQQDLVNADEIIFTNSLRGAQQVVIK